MIEVKAAGLYKTRAGQEVQIYGFDDLGGNAVMAEGFFKDTKHMGWWDPETGAYGWAGKGDPEKDIIGIIPPGDTP